VRLARRRVRDLAPSPGGKIPDVDTGTRERAEQFVRRYGETWGAWDIDGFVELFGEAVSYVAHPDEIVVGRDALRRYVEKEREDQGDVRVRMGRPLVEGDRVMAEFWALGGEDASIAGCLIAHLDPHGICTAFREYWFDLEGRREAFEGWGT
jgi:SnoaL-like domain